MAIRTDLLDLKDQKDLQVPGPEELTIRKRYVSFVQINWK
jgi:hypothetical protein